MKKSWNLIPLIVQGEKIIESRWYQTRRLPWDRVHTGDTIFFKNAGEPVSAYAKVSKVIQYEIQEISDIYPILETYGRKICIVNPDPKKWGRIPRYCILMFLKDPQLLAEPFTINKDGFGTGAAWITVPDVSAIKK